MTDRTSLHVFLLFAQALRTSSPFDAVRVFELLQRISREANLPITGHMDAAVDASLDAMADREPHSAAVARYALERVMVEVKTMLGWYAA